MRHTGLRRRDFCVVESEQTIPQSCFACQLPLHKGARVGVGAPLLRHKGARVGVGAPLLRHKGARVWVRRCFRERALVCFGRFF